MTMNEIQKEKQQLEKQIGNMISDFQKKYKVLVQDIEISSMVYRNVQEIIQNNIVIFIDVRL